MEVTVDRLGPCSAKVSLTVPSAELSATIRRGLSNLGAQANMKGFRPGKVPPQVLEKQYGTRVRHEAMEHFLRQAFDQAVAQHDLKVVGFQRVDLEKQPALEGVDWQTSFEVSLRPPIDLGTYKGLAIESELEQVLDVEVTNAIENLKQQQSRPEPAGDAGLPADGMALAKIEWREGERVVLERDNLRIGPRTPTPGVDAKKFEEALVGAKDGETRDVPMTFPNDFPEASVRGKSGVTRVTVAQAFRMIPPSDADVFKMLNVANEKALREFVREKIAEAKQAQEDQRVEKVLLERLLDEHQKLELPALMVDEQTRARVAQAASELEKQGKSKEEALAEAEAQRASFRETSERGLRALFLVQEIGEREKLLVTREDMEAELKQIAQRNRADLEEVRKYYTDNRLFDQMAVEVLERKVRAFLRQNAKITTPS